MLNAVCCLSFFKRRSFTKMLLIMKLTIFLLIAALQVGARGYSQTLTLSLKNAPLEKVFSAIEKQTGYYFTYTRELLQGTRPVDLQVKNISLKEVLDICLKDQPVTYKIIDKVIIIKHEEKAILISGQAPPVDVHGRVVNEKGEPVAGVTVTVKNTRNVTATDVNGEFSIKGIEENATLLLTSTNIESLEIKVNDRSFLDITVKTKISPLDEVQVIAYGSTTKRFNTGNVTTVKGVDIATQPVSNPLAALEGRVPGMVITQSSGVPGSSFKVEIRGRSSLDMNLSRNDPLFIIDGIPFEPGNLVSSQLVSAANKPTSTNLGGISPFNTINPLDIESIEVLKDADATAIYGSRGANGVILITTKKGKSGKTKMDFNVNKGWSKVSRTMRMLNTTEYLKMRREAFANDGLTPQVSVQFGDGYAPDLLTLDTTIYTDFKKELIGRTAYTTNAEASISGGSDNTSFLIGGAFHNETNVFSDDLSDKRASLHFNLSHKSSNKKFESIFSGLYSNETNKLIQRDLTQFINLPPDFVLYDSTGKPAWSQNGIPINYINSGLAYMPSAELLSSYTSINENALGSIQLSYKLSRKINLKLNSGYNKFTSDEVSINPRSSFSPLTSQLAFSKFATGSSTSWNVDPQIEVQQPFKRGNISVLLGSTFQERTTKSTFINASDYTSDYLLNSIAAAGRIRATNTAEQYRYTAYFGRVNLNWENKYILNLSARRDGSSRFGPGNKFANFGALGSAWILSNESFFQRKIKFLSYSKLRFSYGITGNDQIGNYKYLDLWNSTTSNYQNVPGLQPNSLFNPNFEWEKNKKIEAAIELGAIKDRILFSLAYYRNRSSNQLINYQLPDQTGFTGITKNLPALVQNSGIEIAVTTKNISSKRFNWTSSFNITIPKNKLVSFPGLGSSSYNLFYKEGQSLNIISRAKFLGVDPTTGTYMVEDYNKDGIISFPGDYQFLGNTDPKFYGGVQNSFEYSRVTLSFFLDFRKQIGLNYLAQIDRNPPGIALNQPSIVLNRWQNAGDNAIIQKLTSMFYGSTAATGANYLSHSDGIYSDASFIRLKNVSLSYAFSPAFLKKLHIENSRIYINAQNPLLITKYKGSDPETQDIYVLPPLKTFVIGFNFSF